MALEEVLESKNRTDLFELDKSFINNCPNLAFFRLFFEPFYVTRLALHIPEERGADFRRNHMAVGLIIDTAKLVGYGLAAYYFI
ncbi:MAG: hypothetical protein WC796_03225 [Candidatus Pacearchaeota archaeon]|jgi:hypothetical protein